MSLETLKNKKYAESTQTTQTTPTAPPIIPNTSVNSFDSKSYNYVQTAHVVHAEPIYTYPYNPNNTHNLNENDGNYGDNDNLEKLERFIVKHEISNQCAVKLRQLEGYDVVIIADDSSSMSAPVKNPNTKDFKNLVTRWQEMKETLSVIMELSMILDNDGIDVYFLNRDPVFNVTSQEVLDRVFSVEPKGYTPIVPILRKVMNDKKKSIVEKKLLIILATDGEPTDQKGNSDVDKLFEVLKKERVPKNRIHTTILACTDDDSTMDYLENWDNSLENFDVVDDYYSEKIRIQNAQGKEFRFSRGDYVVKIMLGSIDKEFDSLDGSTITKTQSIVQKMNQSKKQFFKWCNIL